jgi:cold shock protein
MTKAPELDADLRGVELGGLSLSGMHIFCYGLAGSVPTYAFPPGRLPSRTPTRRNNLFRNTSGRKELTVSDREKGTVKWFNGAKGYGFIQRTSGEDVFVHFSVIQENGYRTLNEGETVEYDLTTGPKGLQASNVVRAT